MKMISLTKAAVLVINALLLILAANAQAGRVEDWFRQGGKGPIIISLDEMPNLTDNEKNRATAPYMSPEFGLDVKSKIKKRHMEMDTHGFATASDEQVLRKEKYEMEKQAGSIRPMREAEASAKHEPARLVGFQSLVPQGGIAHGSSNGDGKWSMLTRFFTTAEGESVTLQEITFSPSGGGMILFKEAINQDINGYPAVLVVHESPSGKKVSELLWYTDRKAYVLTTSESVNRKGTLKRFLDLARSVQD